MDTHYRQSNRKKIPSLLLPYITIGIGLYGFQSAWLAILFYHVGMLLLFILNHYKLQFQYILQGWKWTWIWIIPFCSLGGITIYFIWPCIHTQIDLYTQLSRYGLIGWKWTAFLFYYSLVHPLIEQLFWRGFLGHPGKKLRIEDLAFSSYHFFTMILFIHWPWVLLSWFFITGIAWIWRQCVRETGGLIIPILSHLIADVSVIWMVNALL